MGLSLQAAPWEGSAGPASAADPGTERGHPMTDSRAVRPLHGLPGMLMSAAVVSRGSDHAELPQGAQGGAGAAGKGREAEEGEGAARALGALCAALSLQRSSRELGFQLQCALRDASAEWRYVRIQGLQHVSRLLKDAASDEDTARLFGESQLYCQLQVVPVVYANSLAPHLEKLKLHGHHHPLAGAGGGGAAQREAGEASEQAWVEAEVVAQMEREVVLALHCIQGCCLLDKRSRTLALRTSMCQDVATLVLKCYQSAQQTRQAPAPRPSFLPGLVEVVPACLDALVACILNNAQPLVQGGAYERCGLLPAVALLISAAAIPASLRVKAAEFLLLCGCIASSSGDFMSFTPEAEGGKGTLRLDFLRQGASSSGPTLGVTEGAGYMPAGTDVLGSNVVDLLEKLCKEMSGTQNWSMTSISADQLQRNARIIVESLQSM